VVCKSDHGQIGTQGWMDKMSLLTDFHTGEKFYITGSSVGAVDTHDRRVLVGNNSLMNELPDCPQVIEIFLEHLTKLADLCVLRNSPP